MTSKGEPDTWAQKNPEQAAFIKRRWLLKKKYGLSLEDYDRMLQEQGGVCAICREKCDHHKHLAVDHDHKTGKIRGLLCRRCNQTVGKFEDKLELFEAAASYLRKAEP